MPDYVIETNDLTYFHGNQLAVDHLNLNIERGRIYGFLGRNGAGKSTTIKLLLGLLRPTAGSSRVLGCDSQSLTPEIRGRIGYVTEGHMLYRWMRISQLETFQKAFFPKQWDQKLFDDMLDYFELSKKKKIRQLSNGQRAQVSLALTVAPNPELLIMDDPTLGLDVAIRRQFLEGMIQLIQAQGRTILFSSHILSDIERVADTIGVMDKSVLRADCSLVEFRESIKKCRFHYKDNLPQHVDIEGLLHIRRNETELECTLVKTSEEKIVEFANQTNALEYKFLDLNMEDQFIEFTQSATKERLFHWEVN